MSAPHPLQQAPGTRPRCPRPLGRGFQQLRGGKGGGWRTAWEAGKSPETWCDRKPPGRGDCARAKAHGAPVRAARRTLDPPGRTPPSLPAPPPDGPVMIIQGLCLPREEDSAKPAETRPPPPSPPPPHPSPVPPSSPPPPRPPPYPTLSIPLPPFAPSSFFPCPSPSRPALLLAPRPLCRRALPRPPRPWSPAQPAAHSPGAPRHRSAHLLHSQSVLSSASGPSSPGKPVAPGAESWTVCVQ